MKSNFLMAEPNWVWFVFSCSNWMKFSLKEIQKNWDRNVARRQHSFSKRRKKFKEASWKFLEVIETDCFNKLNKTKYLVQFERAYVQNGDTDWLLNRWDDRIHRWGWNGENEMEEDRKRWDWTPVTGDDEMESWGDSRREHTGTTSPSVGDENNWIARWSYLGHFDVGTVGRLLAALLRLWWRTGCGLASLLLEPLRFDCPFDSFGLALWSGEWFSPAEVGRSLLIVVPTVACCCCWNCLM